jgi:hypothetical protein
LSGLRPFRRAALPAFPGYLKALGPGIVWLALAQGSGELIWWPYVVARYGLAFLFLLVPACLIQWPVNYAIGRYTILTGESVLRGFLRMNRRLGILLWILLTASFLWVGAFAGAGGTALAALVDWPSGWSDKARTDLWACLSMAGLLGAFLLSRRFYRFIEGFMAVVAAVTLLGLLLACAHTTVIASLPAFLRGLVRPELPPPRPWNPSDATRLLTAITFAGLGGFWTLFYSYWLRAKGAGMAAHLDAGAPAEDAARSASQEEPLLPERATPDLPRWKRYLVVDSGIGVLGNLLTTLMTCLLAYALLFPKGLYPEGYRLAVVQSEFFAVRFGGLGRLLFLVVAAAFLCDTWIGTMDTVARVHADLSRALFARCAGVPARRLYYLFLGAGSALTTVTLPLAEPGALILLTAVIGFIGTVIYTWALLALNYAWLPRQAPDLPRGGAAARAGLVLACCAYTLLAMLYLAALFPWLPRA